MEEINENTTLTNKELAEKVGVGLPCIKNRIRRYKHGKITWDKVIAPPQDLSVWCNGIKYRTLGELAAAFNIHHTNIGIWMKKGKTIEEAVRLTVENSTQSRHVRKLSTWERIQERIVINKENGCWEWQGSTRQGYGLIGRRINKIKVLFLVHRFSYSHHNGPIPKGKLICHKCDNRKCCNPEHLFIGTHKDNSQDMVNKGRSSKGTKNGMSKLTDMEVLEIKKKKKLGYTGRDLAKIYNVSESHISSIILNKSWKHIEVEAVDTDYAEPIKYNIRGHNKRYSIEQLSQMEINDIKDLKQQQTNLQKIANQYNCTKRLISSV